MSGPWLFTVNAAAWIVIHLGAALFCRRLSYDQLSRLAGIFKARSWEANGALYQRLFRVRRWKSLLPSGGAIFPGGFSLKKVASHDSGYLREWVNESYRAELTHWLAMMAVVIFVLWNPPIGMAINIIYALVVNLPCIITQRYNRPRLMAIVERGI